MAEPVLDGNVNFLGGQDASKDPDKIAQNAFASGINITTEDGSISPRWGWEQKVLDFSQTGSFRRNNLSIISYENLFYTGKFQAIIPYSVGGFYYLIVIVSGIIFLINQDTFAVSVLDIQDGSHISESHDRVNWTPASRYLVIFDFPAYPIIIEGFTVRRADPALDEVPVSNNGSYNNNRLFISNAGNEFTAGDPIGIGFPDAPITFSEILQPSTGFTGQSFQISTNYNNDPLTALLFLQAADTGTGIGPFLVSTQQGIWAYQTQNPRIDWEGGQFGSCLVYNNGIVGPGAVTNVNSDVFYMDPDLQVHTLSMSRDEQASWSKAGISREVKNWLIASHEEGISLTHLSYFKNKIFVTANPFLQDAISREGNLITDTAFGGFAVLEADNISNLSLKSSPVWAGLWNGLYPMQTAANNKQFFIAAKRNGKNSIFLATPERTVDIIEGEERFIRGRIYTRMYDGQIPDQDKTIQSTQLQVPKMMGKCTIGIKYRTSIGENFIDYNSMEHEAPYKLCTVPEGEQLKGLTFHSFRNLNFGSPKESGCNPVTKDNYVTFKNMQYQITLTGRYWEIKKLYLRAMVTAQSEQINSCADYPPVEVYEDCLDDWSVPENSLC